MPSCRRITGEALDVYERAILSAWDSYAELSALLKDDAFRILKELRYVTPRASAERLKAHREGRREARHRDGALRDSARRVHVDGAHHLGHHAAPAAPDGCLRRRAIRGARQVIGRMVDLVRQVDPFFFEKVGCDELPAEALPETRFPAPARWRRRVRRASSTRASTAGCRAWSTTRRAPRQSVAEAVRVDVRPDARRAGRRRGNRSGAEPGAEPVSPRGDERLVPLAADARAASRVLHVREAAEPHRRLAGPAPPDGAGSRGR